MLRWKGTWKGSWKRPIRLYCAVGLYAVCALSCSSEKPPERDSSKHGTPGRESLAVSAEKKARVYIESLQNADGGWPLLPGGESELEATALAVWALAGSRAEGGSPPESAVRGAAFLKSGQSADGGWSGNSAYTAFALAALSALEPDGGAWRSRGLAWLESAQNADGSWGRFAGDAGHPLYTSAVLTVYSRLGVAAESGAAESGLRWLWGRAGSDGGWSLQEGGASDALASAWAARAVLPQSAEAFDPVEWLRGAQNVDGGFSLQKGGQSDPEITAAAASALALEASEDLSSELELVLNYLVYIQQKDGSFISAVPMELSEPAANIQTSSFALLAISGLLSSGGGHSMIFRDRL